MKVEYVNHMGSDLTVVNAARVSMDKHKEELDTSDERLINYLARHEHWTPFGHPQVTIRETVPIFIARQRLRHTIGFVYNETSRRYVDNPPEYFLPDEWRERPDGSIKQGSSSTPVQHQMAVWDLYKASVAKAHGAYMEMLQLGVCPEQARMILPQCMYTSYYVTGSLAAWARAYKLRIDSHAQVEIQELAQKWDEVISPLFPHSWKALTSEE